MPAIVPDDWPEWPQEGLEHLGRCPICGSADRSVLHSDLIDRWFHAPGRWTLRQCGDCRSGYIDPRPDEASIGLAYANYETHRPVDVQSGDGSRLATRLRNGYLNTKYGYNMQPASPWGYFAMHLLPPPLRLEWDHYARHLPKPAPGRDKLLDVGCGNGEFLTRARWQGWEVQGIDLDETAISHARAAGISVVMGTVEPGKFGMDSFDAITSHQVIEHMHRPIDYLKTLFGWLKPGGRLWLGTPNMASTLHKEFGADWRDLHPPQHLVLFTPDSLVTAVSAAGFVKAALKPRGYLDSHFYRQSRQMHSASDVGDWSSFNERCTHTTPFVKQITLETSAWLRPGRCSDLVLVAQKPG